MFLSKKSHNSLKDENARLQEEISLLKAKLTERDTQYTTFFENFHGEMISTIEQHEKVNAQHDELSLLVSKLKERFNNANDSIKKAFNCSEKINSNGEKLLDSAQQMVEQSVVGKKLIANVQKMVQNLGEQMTKNNELMNEVANQSKQIDEIVDLIKGIANETNLLALNASIEAARAGEHGRGFTIVAEKVRDLSEETARSTQGISELTRNFQESIDETIISTTKSFQSVEEGITLSSQANDKFTDIEAIIHLVEEQVTLLQTYIREQNSENLHATEQMELAHNDFTVANEVIISHIEEAEVVDEQLDKGVNLIKDISSQI